MNQLQAEQILRDARVERSPDDVRSAAEIAENIVLYGTPKPLTSEEKAIIGQRLNMTANLKPFKDPRMGLGRAGTKAFLLTDKAANVCSSDNEL